MRQLMAVLLCVSVPLALTARDNSYKVTYDGGSLPDLKAGTGLHLYIDQDRVRFLDNGREVASVPASAITEISYAQDVHCRVGSAIAVGRGHARTRCPDGPEQVQEALCGHHLV